MPRRTSSITAATTSAPTDRGDERRVAVVRLAGQRGDREPERVEERGRADRDHQRVDGHRPHVSADAGGRGSGDEAHERASSAFDFLDREERRQHPQHLRREQRAREHVAGVAVGDDLAVAEHDRVGGDAGRQLDVVGREHHRTAAGGVPVHRVLERSARRRVHATRRLVEQEDRARRRPPPRRSRPAGARRPRGCGDAAPARSVRWSASSQWSTASVSARPSSRCVSSSSRRTVAENSIVFGFCGTYATRTRRSTAPAVGGTRSASARSRVVLPAPLRPNSAMTSPACSSRSTRRTAGWPPSTTRTSRAVHQRRRPARPPRAPPAVGGRPAVEPRGRRASRTVSGGGSQPSARPSRVTVGAPG